MVVIKITTIFVLIFFFVFCSYTQVQEEDTTKYPVIIGLRAHAGSVIIHSKAIRPIKDSYPVGLEVDINWHKNRKKQWDHCHCYPRTGILFSYFYYDNPVVLGNGVATVYYIEPFFGAHKKLCFSFRAGAGITILTKPYDEESNPDNMSYSTYLNSFLLVNLTLNYRLNEKYSINASACYNHTSNGGIQVPNKGINFPSASIGVDYTLNPSEFKNRDKTKFSDIEVRKNRFDIGLLGTVKSYKHGEPIEHVIWGGAVNYSRQVGRISSLVGGAEWMVNGVIKEKIARDSIPDANPYRGGILAGHEFLMGRYNFSIQMGLYFYRGYADYEIVYQRYKLTYRITRNIYAGISVKAHRHIADYLDFRVGYYFERR